MIEVSTETGPSGENRCWCMPPTPGGACKSNGRLFLREEGLILLLGFDKRFLEQIGIYGQSQ